VFEDVILNDETNVLFEFISGLGPLRAKQLIE